MRFPIRYTFVASCASAASGARKRARVSLRPIMLHRMVISSHRLPTLYPMQEGNPDVGGCLLLIPTPARFRVQLSIGSHTRRTGVLPLMEPGKIGLVALKEARHGIHEDLIGRHGSQPTRLFQRQDALHPPIALVTGRALGALTPEDAKP